MKNSQKNNINNEGTYTRKKAIEILVKILENNKPLDNAFEESTKKSSHFSKLINEDKSFCRLLISTTLRNLTSIDYLLTKFLSKPLNKTPLKVLTILRINVAQSFFLKTPDHAVVNTAVELCGKKSPLWRQPLPYLWDMWCFYRSPSSGSFPIWQSFNHTTPLLITPF